MRGIKFEEAKKIFIKRSFWCCLIAIILCWFMKLFGFDLFQLDLENKFFNDLDNFFTNYYIIKQIYCAVMLSIQLYWMTCIVQKEQGKKIWLYILCLLPFTIGIRLLTSIFAKELGMWTSIIEITYLILTTSMFKIKKLWKGLLAVLLLTVYEAISLQTRSLNVKSHANGFMITQILTIDLYLMLYITKEAIIMNDSTWIFFGKTAWMYAVAGFFIGLFTLHPIKKAKEYYAKGKEKENVRKAKRESKKLAKGK